VEALRTGAAEKLGIRLDQTQLDQFHRYYLEIADWNSRVNLTSVTEWEHVRAWHFLGSLAASAAFPPGLTRSGGRVLDVGSGAGLPGLPIKIAFPMLRVTLVEATAKKTAFLDHVTGVLGLGDVEVVTARAETLAHVPTHREGYDVVLARGVARLAALAELTLPFCRLGGVTVAHKGQDVDNEIRQAGTAIASMGARFADVVKVAADGPAAAGTLVVLEKVGPTPERYPRRPGIPTKRPL